MREYRPYPGKVVVRQNGYVIYQSYVQLARCHYRSEPYLISGDLEVTVEREGRQPATLYRAVLHRAAVCSVKVAGSMTSWPGITRSGKRSGRRSSEGTLITGLANGYTLYGYAAGVALTAVALAPEKPR